MKTINRIILSTIIFISLVHSTQAESFKITLPDIPGIEVSVGESVLIPTSKTAVAFQFRDGRIVVGPKSKSAWSYDGGHTWEIGPEGPGEKVAIDLGSGEILSAGRNSNRRSDGKFIVKMRRSKDNWKTVKNENAIFDVPNASFTVTGSGGRVDGFLFHHGILKLPNGELIGSMYGNYEGDVLLCDGYPTELNQRKYRTIVVFSKDNGYSWGDPVLVAYDKMLGRGIPDGHKMIGKSIPESRGGRTIDCTRDNLGRLQGS